MQKILTSTDPASVVADAAKKLRDFHVPMNFDGEDVDVQFDRVFVGECRGHVLEGKNLQERREMARRVLFAMSNISSLLEHGRQSGWGPSHHHKGWEVNTYTKRFMYQPENGAMRSTYALVDIRRAKQGTIGTRGKIYNFNAEGIPSFKTRAWGSNLKMQKTSMSNDSVPYVYTIVGIRFK